MPNGRRVATCSQCGETRSIHGRGLCDYCYGQAKKTGSLDQSPRVRRTFEQSLEAAKASETDSGCWPWPKLTVRGYPATVSFAGRRMKAHVAVWTMSNGLLSNGMEIDHVCHTNDQACSGGDACPHRACVNPAHLEPVTFQEQQRRRHSYTRKTCRNGHARNKANVRWVSHKGYRYRTCHRCIIELAVKRAGPERSAAVAALLKTGIPQAEISRRIGLDTGQVSLIKQFHTS